MKLVRTAVSAALLLAVQAMPGYSQDFGDDATYRRLQVFKSAPASTDGYRMSTSGAYHAMPGHISDDAEYRRAMRFVDFSSDVGSTYRLSTSGASLMPRHIDDDAEARRAARFND